MRHNRPRAADSRALFYRASTAVGLALFVAGAAHAQDQTAADGGNSDKGQVVVVTGIRKSLQDSIATKKKSDEIVEAISSEDIGKLPDASIAESLARLPGLAGQRVNGRVQAINIRGLSGDFATTLLNGRQQVSTGDNRAAEFDQYPAELIGSVTVYKTPNPSLIGQGLSGTADLHTVHPLDYNHRIVSMNVRGSINSNGKLNAGTKDTGNRYSFAYIDQFFDKKLGVAIGYSHLDDPSQTRHYKSWWWDKQGSLFGAGHAGALGLQGAEVEDTSRSQIRDGVMAVVEFHPTDNFRSVNDIYSSTFHQKETTRGLMWYQSQYADSISFTNPTFATWGGTEINTSATVNGVTPILRNDYNTRKDKMFSIGSNNTYLLGDWRLVADAGYSEATRKEVLMEQYAGTAPIRTFDSIGYQLQQNGPTLFSPQTDYADVTQVELGDPAPWGGWGHDGLIHAPEIKDTITSATLSGDREWRFGPFSHVNLGVNFSRREKSHSSEDINLMLKNNRAPVFVDPSLVVAPVDLSWAGITNGTLSYDPVKALNMYYDQVPINNEDQWNKAWDVTEKLVTTYLKMDIDTSLGGIPLSGNAGLQYIDENQHSRGYVTQAGGNGQAELAPFDNGAHYHDVLPMLNLVAKFSGDQYLRIGASRTIARPRLEDLRANVSAGVDITKFTWSGSGGNPNLKPWRAFAMDISYEKYLTKDSYFALAVFHKKLDTYIYTRTDQSFDFTGYPNLSGATPTSNIGTMSRPENGKGGKLQGIELSGTAQGRDLVSWLDGFGFSGSYARSWTDIHPNGPSDPTRLPGFSGTVTNATLFYEKHGFSARISERWRSAFRGETEQLWGTRQYSEIQPDKQIDAQISYDMPDDSALRGLTFLVEAYNLANSPYETRTGTETSNGAFLPETYDTYGSTIIFGVNYKFQ